jgi:hypothetical protein
MDDEIYRITRINSSDEHIRINEESLLNRGKKKHPAPKQTFDKILHDKEEEAVEKDKKKRR